MSHPDEGTIHAWLDGALSAAEAAELETHVDTCAECREAVAGARGLIAAGSRILGALDDVPGGVVPKRDDVSPFVARLRAAPAAPATPVKRWSPQVWAVAATLVMAVGVGVVLQSNDATSPAALETAPPVASAPLNAVVPESGRHGYVAGAATAAPSAAKTANGPPMRRIASTSGTSVAREAAALDAVAKDARAPARAAASPAPAVGGDARAKIASQPVGGGGAASGVAKDAAEPTSAVVRSLSEKGARELSAQERRSEGLASAVAVAPAEKKVLGELRPADKTQDAIAPASRAMMKAAVPASAPAPASSCARITLGTWRSTSQSAAHGVTGVTARPGPTVSAEATVTLDYADGPRTEIGAWLLQPDTARLTVRDARDETILRLLVSRTAGTGIAVLTSAKDNATATATAQLVPEGCAVPKPE